MNRRGISYLILLLICAFPIHASAQEIKGIGVPYIQNYPKSVYLAGNQNWSISRDEQNVMYFGNALGLLAYDGRYWQQHAMPNGQIVRSVLSDRKGKIYTGAFGEFGFWEGAGNNLKYTSLIKLIPKNISMTDEVWKIYQDGDRIIFQSFSSLYIYQHGRIKVVKLPATFLFLYQVDKRFIIEVLNKGLFELKGDQLSPLKNNGAELQGNVLSILPFKDGKLLIGTSKNGLFLYDGEGYRPFNSEANWFLRSYQLNNGTKVLDKYYAFGTILNGLIIINEDGRIVQRINKSSGLQNNTVLSIYTDIEQNLWVGLDNGIDRIELNSPLYFYFDKTGHFGTVYSSIIFQNRIYLGTNQGLFSSPWNSSDNTGFSSFDFQLVPGSQGQVWDLTLIDGQLLCGHNDGTFRVEGNAITKISPESGGWTIKKLNPDYLIQGAYNGLILFKKDASGFWKYYWKIQNFKEPSRYIEQDARGDIWVSHAYKGLYKLGLSPDFKKVLSTKYYDERNGLPSSYGINLLNLENKLLYSSRSGFFSFDEISNKFTKYKVLNDSLHSFASSNKIINAGDQRYWFINQGKVALVNFSKAGKILIDSSSFNMLDGKMVQYYENISKINANMYLISIDDGFAIYNASLSSSIASHNTTLPEVLIRKLEDIKDGRNSFRIAYALPFYRQARIEFQYLLEGYSDQWSDWSPIAQKDFTNLGSGNYKFMVKARVNGKVISKITEMEFSVPPPFYANNWAFFLYFLLFIIALILGKKIYERKLLKDKRAITARMQAEQEEFIRKEAEANEKHIIKLRTEKLQVELAGKNRELANSAMSLVYKNELLQKISEEILKLKDENGKKLADDQLRKIQKVIDEGMNDERDWNLFESSFNEAHESFFKKLKINHPDLVPNDLKLCAYLHMNMSSKEMASLLNISLRGVEIRRYRLRKKLNVPHDKNLVEFLMEL